MQSACVERSVRRGAISRNRRGGRCVRLTSSSSLSLVIVQVVDPLARSLAMQHHTKIRAICAESGWPPPLLKPVREACAESQARALVRTPATLVSVVWNQTSA